MYEDDYEISHKSSNISKKGKSTIINNKKKLLNFILENKNVLNNESWKKKNSINDLNNVKFRKKISHNFLNYENIKNISILNILNSSPKFQKKKSVNKSLLSLNKQSIKSLSNEAKKSTVTKSKNLLSKEDSNIKYLISNIIKEINNPIRKTSKKIDINYTNTKKLSRDIEIQSYSNGIIESNRSNISKSDDDNLKLINNKPNYYIGIRKSNIKYKTSDEDVSQDGDNELKEYIDLDFPLNIGNQELHENYQKDFTYKLFNRNRELFKYKNIYDSLSEGDNSEEENNKWYFINPMGLYKIIWDLLGLVLVIYILIEIPYNLAFNIFIQDEFYYDMLITFYFIVDIILIFVTGYFENDVIIYSLNKILVNKVYTT